VYIYIYADADLVWTPLTELMFPHYDMNFFAKLHYRSKVWGQKDCKDYKEDNKYPALITIINYIFK